MKAWPYFSVSDGTEDRNRCPRALEPDYFQPDERRFDELLALGTDLGRMLPFRDLSNRLKGTWGDLFMGNEAAIMALILAQDIGRLELGFATALELGLDRATRFTYERARDIDFWLTGLGRCSGRTSIELRERFEALVHDRLAADLGALAAILRLLGEDVSPLGSAPLGGFHRAWGFEPAGEEVDPAGENSEPPRGSPDLRAQLRQIFSSLVSVIAHLQSLIPPYLSESLQDQRHEPAIALFIVFLKLLEKARLRLNGFTERHLEFYYGDVLGIDALPHRPDYVLLSLQTAKGQDEVHLPAGTEFVATADAEAGEIRFLSDRDALASDAKVQTLCTLCFERDRLISPERELGYVTRIKALRRDLGAAGGAAAPSSLPFFGADAGLGEDARVGFAVASPVLLLREGQRIIDVQIQLSDPGESSQLRNEVLMHVESGGSHDRGWLVAVFSRLLSTEHDWLQVTQVADRDQAAKRLAMSLDPGEIDSAVQSTVQAGSNPIYSLFLKALLRQPLSGTEGFYRLLGRIFSRHLLRTGERPDADLVQALLARAGSLLEGEALTQVKGLFGRGRQEVFQKLLEDIFEVSLTVPSGWHEVPKYVMRPLDIGPDALRTGLRFLLTLGSEVEPIVPYSPQIHGGHWSGDSPIIQFRLNSRANFCAYSLLNDLRLTDVAIDVKVRGLRDLRLSNNLGPIDHSKPFQPFGPLPALSSNFVLGSFEMARKQITGLTLKLEWADLPTSFGGFASHYADYEQAYHDQDFVVDISVLQNGVWQPPSGRRRQEASLFEQTGPTQRLNRERSIDIRILDFYRPIDNKTSEEQFNFQLGVGNGFFRLGLVGPEGVFGHADYPILLAKSLSENLRSKVFKKVPNPPYTPLISQISVDYAARTKISVDGTGSGARSDRAQRIFHLHPFGYHEIEPSSVDGHLSLLPKYESDGNLFIGIKGGQAVRSLDLLFHLTEETDQQVYFDSPQLSWYYLSTAGWRQLPTSNLVMDATNGFLGSGIVTLILPLDIDRQSTLMPAGMAWVRVGANASLAAFPGLYAVYANAVRATRRIDTTAGDTRARNLPHGCRWRPLAYIPGLGAVDQVGTASAEAPTETPRRFKARVSDRLCHKNRAITAKDYERLVLQQFPGLFKVKCFAAMATANHKPRPGHVLIVVVPHASGVVSEDCRRPMVDVLQLKEIRRFVQEVSSPFVDVEVRNPLYERVQARCKVKLADETNPGLYIRRLNQEISDFLCPWVPFGYQARFGWTISCDEVMGFVRQRDYVEFVSDFSMLHITEDNPDYHTLADTVGREPGVESAEGRNGSDSQTYRRSNLVRWRYPWSLALPMDSHFIEALGVARPIEPEPVGIGELAIGSTFII